MREVSLTVLRSVAADFLKLSDALLLRYYAESLDPTSAATLMWVIRPDELDPADIHVTHAAWLASLACLAGTAL